VARVSAAALGRLCQLCGAAAVSPLLPSLDERRRARTLDREHVLGLRELLQRGSPLPPADRQPIVALLEAAARDRLQPPLLREAAVFALWRFDPARAFPQARKLLADPDPTVKAAAQSVLKRQRPR
jgi:HEAT repeat protein